MMRIPTITQYLFGFAITLAVFGLVYIGENLGLLSISTINPLLILLAGLLIGHLIGALVTTRSQTSATKNPPAQDGVQTIYVGNLPFKTNRNQLRALFEPFGQVHSARIVIDKATRKPRGYGFVEMDSSNANKAINKLDGSIFDGRNIKVNEASQRNPAAS
ncbi:RNA recognition motif domain-containing protein [Kaarinaea lacus]